MDIKELLEKSAEELGYMIMCAGDFADLWAGAESKLSRNVQSDSRVPDPIRIHAIRRGWEDIETKLVQYRTSVSSR